MTNAQKNPLLSSYQTIHETFPFDKIKPEHYLPAFEEGIKEKENEVTAIANNPEPATFDNTVIALEQSGKLLSLVHSAFFAVLEADATDEMMALSEQIMPKLTECNNNIYLNEKLFARIKAVYDQRTALNLSSEDSSLLQETFNEFANSGANLSPEKKKQYRQLTSELSTLTLKYDQNALKDLNRYELLITNEQDLAGLPSSSREAAANAAKEKGETGWLFDLSAPSYVPFMRYADNRSLREKMYRARMAVANQNDEYDNKENIRKIVNIRLEIAQLMGYKDYATYKLKDKMAKDESHVYQLLNQLLDAYKPAAIKELKDVQDYASQLEKTRITIMPWDWSYYSEKLRDSRFNINDEMTRAYFELNPVINGIFGLATRLYGITFKENKQIPTYNTEVKTYEVFDENGNYLATLYTDFFPRKGKQSGAWMNCIQPQYKMNGSDHRPHIVIVMNFTRPTGTKPSLLTYDEVNTFLHEFGHALHGILAQGTYASLSGTGVKQDFVELPSQIMENWLREKEFLDQIAIHYQTDEKIPDEMVNNILNSANFNAGYACCRQVSFGLLDMAWYTLQKPFEGDVIAFEKEAWKRAVTLPEVEGTLFSSNFNHIFSGGYAAGYYGYKWAEVLDADAFSLFKKEGIFNPTVAHSFRDNILKKGGSEDPNVLYKHFRGQDPTIDALLKRDGIKN